MSKSPCYECEERHQGCHSKCKQFKAYTEERIDRKKKIKASRDEYMDFINYNKHKAMRLENRRKRRKDD